MRKIWFIVSLFFSQCAFSQTDRSDHAIIIGFGQGTSRYMKGPVSGFFSYSYALDKNSLRFTLFTISGLGFGTWDDPTTVDEYSISYHRALNTAKLQPSIGMGVSLNRHVINSGKIPDSSNGSRYIDKTFWGIPIYASVRYKMARKFDIGVQYHYNINSHNAFMGTDLLLSFKF